MKSSMFRSAPRWLILLLPAAAVTVVSLWTLISVTLEAAAGSAPGDLLYPAREQALHIQLDLTTDPAERAALELSLQLLTAPDMSARADNALSPTQPPVATGRESETGGSPKPDQAGDPGMSGHAVHREADVDDADDETGAENEPTANPTPRAGGDLEDDDTARSVGAVDDQDLDDADDDDQDTDTGSDDDEPSGADGDREDESSDGDDDDED